MDLPMPNQRPLLSHSRTPRGVQTPLMMLKPKKCSAPTPAMISMIRRPLFYNIVNEDQEIRDNARALEET